MADSRAWTGRCPHGLRISNGVDYHWSVRLHVFGWGVTFGNRYSDGSLYFRLMRNHKVRGLA